MFYDVVLFLADVPYWVLTGCFCGLVTGLCSLFIPNKAALIMAVALSIVVSRLSLPVFEQKVFQAAMIKSIEPTPRKLDEVTSLNGISFIEGNIERDLSILATITEVQETKAIIKDSILNSGYCTWYIENSGKGYFKEDIFRYETNLGIIVLKGEEFGC